MQFFKPVWKSNNSVKALKWVEDHKYDKNSLKKAALYAQLAEVKKAAVKSMADLGALDELADDLCPEAYEIMPECELLKYATVQLTDPLKKIQMYNKRYGEGFPDEYFNKHIKEISDMLTKTNIKKRKLAWDQLKKIAGQDVLVKYYRSTGNREAKELWIQRLDKSVESVLEDTNIPTDLKVALAEKRNDPQLQEMLCKMEIHCFVENIEKDYDSDEDRFIQYRYTRCKWCGKGIIK